MDKKNSKSEFLKRRIVFQKIRIHLSRSSDNQQNKILHRFINGMTNLDSLLKDRNITLPTMVHLIKAVVFPVVMYRCQSWTIKKTELWRIDDFELCWKTLLRAPWTDHKEIKQVNLKGNHPWIFTGSVREAHWLKPPTLARHHSNHLRELFHERRSW